MLASTHVVVSIFALPTLRQASFVHRIRLAEINKNITKAVHFSAVWARLSNDFSVVIGGDIEKVWIRKLEINFPYEPYPKCFPNAYL